MARIWSSGRSDAGIQRRGDELQLAIGVEVRQGHFRAGLRFPAREAGGDVFHCLSRGGEIAGPPTAAIRLVDAREERGDHLPQLDEHLAGARTDLGERARAHPQEQRLEGLAGAVDADVRLRRRRQHAAQRVERLGADGRPVDAVRISRRLRIPALEVFLHRRDPFRVPLERVVHRAHVAVAQRAPFELRRDVIPPAAVQPIRVGHVAGRLLEVRHQPAPLEHFRQDVRHVFAGDVRAAELCDRVVAVLVEHARVQLLGARDRRAPAGRLPGLRRADLVGEFVEEQAAQRLGGSRVPREQRPFHGLGKIDEREDVAIEVGEVRREPRTLVRSEFFGRHDRIVT